MTDYLIDDDLAEEDLLACATRVAETLDNLVGHGEAMTAMAARYTDAGQLDFAAALVETINDPYIKDEALASIAVKAAEMGERDHALELLKSVEDPSFRANALAQIAIKQAEAGDYDAAIEVADRMDDTSSTMAEIAVKCAEGGQHDRAFEIIQTIEYVPSAVWALTEMASRRIKAGQQAEAVELLNQALGLARSIELEKDRASMLIEVALKYADAGESERAAELLREASSVAETIEITSLRESALVQASFGYARIGYDERAVAVVAKIDDAFRGAMALAGIAAEHLNAGRQDEALALLSRAMQRVVDEEFYDEGDYPAARYRALTEIAVQYTAAAQYDKAAQTARMIEADKERDGALMMIVRNLVGTVANDSALPIARLREDGYLKTLAFTEIAGALLKSGQQEVALTLLSEARGVAEAVVWDYQKILALIAVALKYAEAERRDEAAKLLLQALETSRTTTSAFYMALSLAQLSDAYHETGIEIDEGVSNILHEIVITLD
jgi:tetratricopeptide (TPR) repeat protein